jgi:predicted dehydrogenase
MERLRIGILCPSEIAFRRFLPSLRKLPLLFEYAGVATACADEWFGGAPNDDVIKSETAKAESFRSEFGGEVFFGYGTLLSRKDIDCVYIPLPPALHYEWAKKALFSGKHVLVEKPFTDSLSKTEELIELAKERNLAVHENYMFQYHSQIEHIISEISNGTVGEVRLYRLDFGFPFRGMNDFRYNKALGGGALLDCGGYTLKLASILLGETARIVHSSLRGKEGFDVDIYGNATLVNADGTAAQLSFGMDNAYKCSLEVWGSTGTIFTNRIFTAPDGFTPVVITKIGNTEGTEKILPPDDSFKKSLERFYSCVCNADGREENTKGILRQARLVEEIKERYHHANHRA